MIIKLAVSHHSTIQFRYENFKIKVRSFLRKTAENSKHDISIEVYNGFSNVIMINDVALAKKQQQQNKTKNEEAGPCR